MFGDQRPDDNFIVKCLCLYSSLVLIFGFNSSIHNASRVSRKGTPLVVVVKNSVSFHLVLYHSFGNVETLVDSYVIDVPLSKCRNVGQFDQHSTLDSVNNLLCILHYFSILCFHSSRSFISEIISF